MYIRNDASSLIFSVFLDRKRQPAGRQGRPKRPIMDSAPIIFLPLLLTGKVAENQNQFLKSRFKFRNLEDLSKDLKSFYASSTLFERVFVYIFGLITLL
jgi:hypothetical protein